MTALATKSDHGLYHSQEAALYDAHFRSLQKETGQLAPPKKAFNPSHARAFLRYLGIFEITAPGVAVTRLFGTGITNRVHLDSTGHNFIERFPEAEREAAWQRFLKITQTPCGCTYVLQEVYGHRGSFSEILSLPFADEKGEARFILSLSAPLNLQDLLLHGEDVGKLGALAQKRWVDIGAGT